MSDLGYQNNAQAGLMPAYNTLQSYMTSLARALQIPYPPYEEIGLRRGGEWVQISTNLLQIENEYYATIRPKRVIRSGERPLEALCTRGVQYIEVRCMDVDPFAPIGISLETSRFLDAFLTFCALDESRPTSEVERRETTENFARAVKEGRRPGLKLSRRGGSIGLTQWAEEMLERIQPVAAMLDALRGDQVHARTLEVQRAKLRALDTTPSAVVLETIRGNGGSFLQFGLSQSQANARDLRARPLGARQLEEFRSMAKASLAEQEEMERTQSGNFDDFITQYRQRTPPQLCQ
jgi:glutamate--cysteine ligase